MKDYVKRMIEERASLFAKIERAEKFIDCKPDISIISLVLLRSQVAAMNNYLNILDIRIEYERTNSLDLNFDNPYSDIVHSSDSEE